MPQSNGHTRSPTAELRRGFPDLFEKSLRIAFLVEGIALGAGPDAGLKIDDFLTDAAGHAEVGFRHSWTDPRSTWDGQAVRPSR
jgi:hypothetical protein